MVLPINHDLDNLAPHFVRLLVPDDDWENEKKQYSKPRWYRGHQKVPTRNGDHKSTDFPNGSVKGWSNYPIMVWIVAFLVQEKVIAIEDSKELFEKTKPKPTLREGGPTFIVGDCGKKFSFVSLVDFLLFEMQKDEHQPICEAVNKALEPITKDRFYNDLDNMFEINGQKGKQLGSQLKLPPTSIGKPIGSGELTSANTLSESLADTETVENERLGPAADDRTINATIEVDQTFPTEPSESTKVALSLDVMAAAASIHNGGSQQSVSYNTRLSARTAATGEPSNEIVAFHSMESNQRRKQI